MASADVLDKTGKLCHWCQVPFRPKQGSYTVSVREKGNHGTAFVVHYLSCRSCYEEKMREGE